MWQLKPSFVARSVFQVVFLAIIAQSCQHSLVAPQNGSIECGNQTVGETCTFYCDDGFTLRGTPNRTCQPSLQWTGRPTVCDPPMCPELVSPSNGHVLFPCARKQGDICRVDCAHGYKTVGPNMQICEHDMNNDLMWSIGPKCDGK